MRIAGCSSCCVNMASLSGPTECSGRSARKRRARRRAVSTRTPILVEARQNARWSLDFVHDQSVVAASGS